MQDHKSSPPPPPPQPQPQPAPGSDPASFPTPAHARRIPPELRIAAVERLVSAPDRTRAARSLIESAHQHGIDLELLWGAVHPPVLPQRPRLPAQIPPPTVSQTCLAVPTAGRTAMLFLSAPDARFGPPSVQRAELAETLRLALRELPKAAKTPLVLAQTLLETHHDWAEAACRDAGLTWVGRLHFMRLPWPVRFPPDTSATQPWPDDITVAPVANPLDFTPHGDGAALAHALEATYADTLDCPELCGLRHTRDVITSHMATGEFDPKRWWIIRRGGVPEGCCLLNHCPANRAVELVYLGMAPNLRGRRLARRLLTHALTRVDSPDAREITCAVDTRNTPAVKLYHAMGFRNFGSRTGFVMPLAGAQIEPKIPASVPPGGQSGSFGTSGGQENVASAKRL